MKWSKLIYNRSLLVVLGVISLGMISPMSMEWFRIGSVPLIAEMLTLVLAFYMGIMLNIHILVPRLLLRNRFIDYIASLFAITFIILVIETGYEYIIISRYHLLNEEFGYFADDNILFLKLLSPFIAYNISIAGTALFIVLHLWTKSGAKIHDLEEESTRSELEEVRTRIDSKALFHTLDEAAILVRQSPSEVSALLMNLSKSLRIQLYESEYKRNALPPELSGQTFNFSSPLLNFLSERRWHLCRHLLLTTGFILISIDQFDGTWSSVLQLLFSALIYLSIVYFNIYVLMPKWLMRNKIKTYLVTVALSILVAVVPVQLIYFSDVFNGYGDLSVWVHLFFTISTVIKLSFPIIGINAFLLFLYWVRNERRIIKLETATMLSELEQLQSQVNPHFLFNMLNNVIVLTKTEPDEAAVVLRKLSDMLKYQFHGFTKQSIRLGDDIHFLTDYLNLEKLRRDNFEFSITVKNEVEKISLPPLLFIPFVENAVKHNNDNLNLSFVQLRFGLVNDTFCFGCINSKPLRQMRNHEVGGLGLPNVRRRLDLLYGNRYRLEIKEDDTTYSVQLKIKLKTQKYKGDELHYC